MSTPPQGADPEDASSDTSTSTVASSAAPPAAQDDQISAPKQKESPPAVIIDDASPLNKKCLETMSAIARGFVCPITQELPTDPVTAEDGKCYEREAILTWFARKEGDPISPSTITPWAEGCSRLSRCETQWRC